MLREHSAYRDFSKRVSRAGFFFFFFFNSCTHSLNMYIDVNYVSGEVLSTEDTVVKDRLDSCP